jgi:hypothetical protein
VLHGAGARVSLIRRTIAGKRIRDGTTEDWAVLTMQIYADTPGRRAAQVVGDVASVLWIWLGVWAAMRLHDLVVLLGEPGAVLEDAGNTMSARVGDAAEAVAGVPAIGDDLRQPFDVLAEAGRDIAGAGARQQEVVTDLAVALSAAVVVFAIALVVVSWLPWRVRWVLRVRATHRMLVDASDPALFALRALTNRPLRQLHRVHPDPARAWRAGDPGVTAALAELELASLGLRPRRTV